MFNVSKTTVSTQVTQVRKKRKKKKKKEEAHCTDTDRLATIKAETSRSSSPGVECRGKKRFPSSEVHPSTPILPPISFLRDTVVISLLALENYLPPSLSYEIQLIRRDGARFAYSIRSPHISRVKRCTPPDALPPLTRERTPRAPTRAAHFGQLTPSAETSGPFASWAPPLLAQSGGGDAVDCGGGGGGGGPRWWWQ